MLRWEFLPQARREHMSQTYVEAVYYDPDDPHTMDNKQKKQDTK